jgi:DNA-binding MarR family transcriptional regulator
MGRSANGLTRKASGGEKPAAQGSSRQQDWELNLDALRQTPGFMIRILQLLNFEAFYRHFKSLELSPVEYAILIIVRDNKTVTQSELAAVLKMHLPNLVKILFVMEEAGIIKRKRSARDKRAVELSLSAAGQRRADEASRLGEIFNARTLAPLSKPEQTAFMQMLARLADAYRRELSSRDDVS